MLPAPTKIPTLKQLNIILKYVNKSGGNGILER